MELEAVEIALALGCSDRTLVRLAQLPDPATSTGGQFLFRAQLNVTFALCACSKLVVQLLVSLERSLRLWLNLSILQQMRRGR